ncbi:MAG: A/G-specific adenine glycosylase [Planctomycetes bacterium]|nr:A/G-specific adenine glycosylase [Planctomycetota bacterium]
MPKHPDKSPVELPDASWRRRFRGRLRRWYARNRRDLPWRRRGDPYAIWVSEIMLQQTQVATVEAYFSRFLQAFPNVAALAAAEEHEVLRLWEGLGYYRRARQMHRAAGLIVREHDGRFPRDRQTLNRLPGIGRYTAGAILSIAFDRREPILEANTVRLFSRLLAFADATTTAAAGRLLWAMAEAVLPRREVGTFNQALMELGSQVCTPRAPDCRACPVGPLCRAAAEGIQAEIPAAKIKPEFEFRREVAVVVRRRGHVFLRQCPPGERWAGLWDFPRVCIEAESPSAAGEELIEKVRLQTGLVIEPGAHLTTIKHGVTRFRITLDCYRARYVSALAQEDGTGQQRWVKPAELADYPLCTTGRKIAKLLAGGVNT